MILSDKLNERLQRRDAHSSSVSESDSLDGVQVSKVAHHITSAQQHSLQLHPVKPTFKKLRLPNQNRKLKSGQSLSPPQRGVLPQPQVEKLAITHQTNIASRNHNPWARIPLRCHRQARRSLHAASANRVSRIYRYPEQEFQQAAPRQPSARASSETPLHYLGKRWIGTAKAAPDIECAGQAPNSIRFETTAAHAKHTSAVPHLPHQPYSLRQKYPNIDAHASTTPRETFLRALRQHLPRGRRVHCILSRAPPSALDSKHQSEVTYNLLRTFTAA